MDVDSRSFLLGLGLFGMVLGACFGLVAGKLHDECAAAEAFAGAERAGLTLAVLDGMCARVSGLRMASFGLVGMSAAGALIPAAQARLAARRADA